MRIHPIASGTADVEGLAAASGLKFAGFSVTENAAGTAQVQIHYGTSASGPEMFDIRLASGESAVCLFPASPIETPAGVWVERISGTTKLTLFTI